MQGRVDQLVHRLTVSTRQKWNVQGTQYGLFMQSNMKYESLMQGYIQDPRNTGPFTA